MKKKLSENEVIFHFNLNKNYGNLSFKDLEEISDVRKKIKKSIDIDKPGYNLFIVDNYSRDRIEITRKWIENMYRGKKLPTDIVLCTLQDINNPISLILPGGKGKYLKESIDDLKNMYYNVSLDFYELSANSERDKILEEIERKQNEYIDKLIDFSKKEGFDVKASKDGFAFVPITDKGEMTESEYEGLTCKEKELITEGALNLKNKAQVIIEKLKEIEIKYNDKLKEIYLEHIMCEMYEQKENTIIKFIDCIEASKYIENLCNCIEKDLVNSYNCSESYEFEKGIDNVLNKYTISILINNKDTDIPKVIYEEEPTINNLFGYIEYESEEGVYTSKLSSVYPGSILRANNGCLIIRLSSLIENPLSYNMLKKSLIKGSVTIDSNKNYLDILPITGLKIKDIKVNTKIILIGDLSSYNILYSVDEDFRNLFKMKIEYPKEVKVRKGIFEILRNYIINKCENLKLLKIDEDAVVEVIKYLSRISGNRNKVNIDLEEINKIIIIASAEAKTNNKLKITKDEINKILYEDEFYSEKIDDFYRENKIILPLSDKLIGSVNGLAVIDTGYFSCGKIIRITGVCSKGSGKIIDTHKECNMSGKIHEKSLSILSGLLNGLINPYNKIQVDFHLSFEQVYGEIDGDSASVAEMICMLSALSKLSVKQNIAVTGSLNQFGEVQPIGGINEKIEGFYKISSMYNKNKVAVVIPALNKDEIVLNSELEDAVRNNKIEIYTMETIEDAIEIMILDGKMSMKEFWKIVNDEVKKFS